MKWLPSSAVARLAGSAGRQKLGQPLPDSNLCSDRNNSAPQQTQR